MTVPDFDEDFETVYRVWHAADGFGGGEQSLDVAVEEETDEQIIGRIYRTYPEETVSEGQITLNKSKLAGFVEKPDKYYVVPDDVEVYP